MDTNLSTLSGAANLAMGDTKAPTVNGAKNAKQAAQDFESFFASQVLQQMFADVKTDGLFGGGHGEEMFRSLLLDAYAKKIGQTGGFGIGNMVMKSMLAQQEVQS
jgi:Rod binding domain-containing protein